MIRPLLVGALLLMVSTPFVAARNPAPPPQAIPGARSLPMQFDWRREGPAEVCGAQCRTWISAVGTITADTPKEFETFSQDPAVRGATIVFDSEGGSVLGSLALGRAIRKLQMTTSVGRPAPVAGTPENDPRATISHDAYCESMCAFVLLGGVRRYVPAEARVQVHQIWLGDRRNDAMAANYSAEDLVLVQRDIGRLAQYNVEMGASIDLLETALRIPPWEPMRRLSVDEVTRMQVATVETLFDRRPADVATNAAPAPEPAPPAATLVSRSSTVNERSWGLLDQNGASVLARRHPLTVEGERIGQFDLLLGCGTAPDTYTLTYVESRRSADARPPSRVKDVAISIARNQVTLPVASSDVRRSNQVVTIARGPLPAALAAALAETASRSVIVAVSSANGSRTMIRVGNTGVAQHFAQLAAVCGKTQPTRSAHAAGL